jgi:threonine synthase
VYYFAGYFQATRNDGEHVSFAVPSGNFGNICAGHVARMMGLPIRRLVLATNENNVLDEFFRTGTYRVRGSAETHETSSPSMDISKASNFERFVFDLLGRDAQRTRDLFKTQVEQHGAFTLSAEEFARIPGFGFVSGSSTHTWQRFGVMIDTHTADGLKVAREHAEPGVPTIVLETALPAKFAETIHEAIGREPERPKALQGIESLPKRCKVMPVSVQAVKDYIRDNV